MTELSNAEQDFLTKKAELQTARQNEAKKRGDIVELNRRQQDLNIELEGLNKRLMQSSQLIVNSDMTSDDYIALKRSIADKKLEIEAIGEMLTVQTGALQMLIDHTRHTADRFSRQLSVAAGEVKQRALSAGVAAGTEPLKAFVLAVAAEHLHQYPFTSREKTEQAQLGYCIIGEELCKALFADETEAWLFLVEPSRAKDAVEAMIGQAA